MPRRVYTPEFRERAVGLAVEFGPAEAARLLGDVKAATIRNWCSLAGVITVTAINTRAATEVRQAQWEERRVALVHEMGEVAAMALAEAKASVGSHARNAKDYATTMAILVDKAQLLSGGATSRAEHTPTEEVHHLIDELAARRSA